MTLAICKGRRRRSETHDKNKIGRKSPSAAGNGIGAPPRTARRFPELENFRCLQVLAG